MKIYDLDSSMSLMCAGGGRLQLFERDVQREEARSSNAGSKDDLLWLDI